MVGGVSTSTVIAKSHTSNPVLKLLIVDPLYFVLWWYSAGFVQLTQRLRTALRSVEHFFALGILVRNLGKPLFGDYTFKGRLIGFFLRLGQLVLILLLLLVVLILGVGLLVTWLVVIPFAGYTLLYALHVIPSHFLL